MTKRFLHLTLAMAALMPLGSVAQHRTAQGLPLPPESAETEAPPRHGPGLDAGEFDKIKTWIGEGENRCGMSFIFGGKTIVLGYRWSGTKKKTASDAMKEIAAKEPRFYQMVDPAMMGFGWDYNQDGNLTLVNKNDPKRELTFDETRTIHWGKYDDLAWKSKDEGDLWYSAWWPGYWQYYTSEGPGQEFVYSQVGAGSRILKDGCWDEWVGQNAGNFSGPMGREYVEPLPDPNMERTFSVDGIRYEVIEPLNSRRLTVMPPEEGVYTGAVVIPDTVHYKGVNFRPYAIADAAFERSTATTVSFPATVGNIGARAFADSKSLTAIDFTNASTLGAEVCSGCAALREVTIGRAFNTLAENMFTGCPAVVKVTVMNSRPETLPPSAFSPEVYSQATLMTPTGLSRIYLTTEGWSSFTKTEENPNIGPTYNDDFVLDGIHYAVLEKEIYPYMRLKITGYDADRLPEQLNIPYSLSIAGNEYHMSEIADEAFMGAPIRSLTFEIPLKIGKRAFKDCTQLTGEVSLSGCDLYEETFAGCSALQSIKVSGARARTFADCSSLATVELTKGTFSDHAFDGCFAIRSVSVPDAKTAQANTFPEEIYAVATLYVPRYMKETVMKDAVLSKFANIEEKDDIAPDSKAELVIDNAIYKKFNDGFHLIEFDDIEMESFTPVEQITIAGQAHPVTQVCPENGSFKSAKIKRLTIPGCIEYVKGFSSNQTIESVEFLPNDSISIGEYAFLNCRALKNVTLPSGLRKIDRNAFEKTGIETITIPDGVERLDDDVFSNCSSLTEIILPEHQIEYIGYERNIPIKKLHFPDGWTTAGGFYYCPELEEVTGMKNVTKIAFQGFHNCPKLSKINLDKIEEVCKEAFNECSLPETLTLPSIKKVTDGWGELGPFSKSGVKHVILPAQDTIPSFLFYQDEDFLTKVTAPKAKYIGEYALAWCYNLAEFDFSNVEEIDEYAFQYCDGLPPELSLPKAKTIKKGAFDGSYTLSKITLPEAEYVSGFSGCEELTYVEMPKVRTIGDMAFYQCTKMDFGILNFPDVLEIGSNAFNGCTVKEAYLPNATHVDGFSGIKTLEKVVCPKAKYVGSFGDCSALKSIDYIQAEEIGSFRCWDNSSSLELPDTLYLPNLKKIGYGFSFCKGPKVIIMPHIQEINNSFQAIPTLTDLVLGYDDPETVNYVAIFGGSRNVTTRVWFTNGTVASGAHPGFNNTQPVYLLAGTSEDFRTYKVNGYSTPFAECNLRELTVAGLKPGEMTVKADLDAATLTMSADVKYAEEAEGLWIPEQFREANAPYALRNTRANLQWSLKGYESGASLRIPEYKNDAYVAELTGLTEGTEYSYRWADRDNKPLAEVWEHFTTVAWPQNMDYTKGWWMLNEDWYGTDNSSIAFVPDNGERAYTRAFRRANPGKALGITSQFGTVFADKLLVVNKQPAGPSGVLTVADASTLKLTGGVEIPANGRAVAGYDSHKAYVSTSNGLYPVDLDNLKAGEPVQGTTSDSGLYSGQLGEMTVRGDSVFVAAQGRGVLVIDATTDKLVAEIDIPDILTVMRSGSGTIYAVTPNRTGQFAAIDPETLEVTRTGFDAEDRVFDAGWGTWRKFPVAADPSSDKVYMVEQTPDYGGLGIAAYSVAEFDLATGTYRPGVITTEMLTDTLPDGSLSINYPYGTGIGFEPSSGEIKLFTAPGATVKDGKGTAGWDYQQWTLRSYKPTEEGLCEPGKEISMSKYYWFPAMLIATDRFMPELLQTPEDMELATEDCVGADPSVEKGPVTVDYTGFATDADPADTEIRYTLTAAEINALTVTPEGGARFTLTPLAKGSATLTLRAESNGRAVEQEFTANVNAGQVAINGISADSANMSYNLSDNALKLSGEGDAYICAADGRVIRSIAVSGETTVSLDNLTSGVYIVRFGRKTLKISL